VSEILDRLMKGVSFGKAPLSYDQEKELAGHQDATVRRKRAARHDIRPEILYYLAEDTLPLSSSGGFPMSEKEMKHRLDSFLDL